VCLRGRFQVHPEQVKVAFTIGLGTSETVTVRGPLFSRSKSSRRADRGRLSHDGFRHRA